MALQTVIFVNIRDGQNRTATFEVTVPSPAGFTTGVDLPTSAHILGIINDLVGATASDKPSNGVVYEYGVKITETDLTGITENGDGATAVQTVCRTISDKGGTGEIDRFGVALGTILKVPAANENAYVFNNADRNQVSTSTGPLVALRTALVAAGWMGRNADGTYQTILSAATFEEASLFTGKRALMRPR